MRRRFEVRREMNDSGKIRPDNDKHNNQKVIDPDLLEEAERVGFDDEINEPLQENIEIKTDKNGNPILPNGWTFLIHDSTKDEWDTSLLGKDFVVGNCMLAQKETDRKPLFCVDRSVAEFDYGITNKDYAENQHPFQIRVLFYKDPKAKDGNEVREKLNIDEQKDVSRYYTYQQGWKPAVPIGTKLTFLKNGDFDEITNTNGNDILWYIPEQYLQKYIDDTQQTKEILDKSNNEVEPENKKITNADVEQELQQFYNDDIGNDYLEAYLAEKIPQVYGDRLSDAGIFNIKKFLDGRLDDFQGVDSYKKIIKDLDSMLQVSEHEKKDIDNIQPVKTAESSQQKQTEHTTLLDRFSYGMDPVINGMENFEEKMDKKIDYLVAKTENVAKLTFEQSLMRVGFSPDCIKNLKHSIQMVSAKALIKMDKIMDRTKESERGEVKDDRNP